MFKIDRIIDLGLYNQDFLIHEDKELMARFQSKYKISNIKLPLYRYRKHSSNITNNETKSKKYFEKLDT